MKSRKYDRLMLLGDIGPFQQRDVWRLSQKPGERSPGIAEHESGTRDMAALRRLIEGRHRSG